MSTEQTDVELSIAVVSFDGRVLEVFGHRTADRIHIAEITGIKSDDNTITVTTRNQVDHTIVINEADELMRGDLETLIERVRSAAPNLKEG
jgi:hypothetical protein